MFLGTERTSEGSRSQQREDELEIGNESDAEKTRRATHFSQAFERETSSCSPWAW